MVQPDGAQAPPPQADTTNASDPPKTSATDDEPKKIQINVAAPTKPPKAGGYAYLFKYVVVGDCGVGKSALLQRFANDTFVETHQYTIGVDFHIKTLELPSGDEVKLQMWDTAGQERYRNITFSYYRGAHGVIIAYDINSKESFDSIPNWIRETQTHCNEDAVTIIVGTKKDLEPDTDEERYGADKVREVLKDNHIVEGTTESSDILGVYEVSAKTNEGVDKAFQAMTDHLVTLKLNERNPLRGGKKGKTSTLEHDTIHLNQDSKKPKSRCC